MRQITKVTASALRARQAITVDNTKVMGADGHAIMTLHDNVIATYGEGRLILTDSGWQTTTTKERLNSVLMAFGIDKHLIQRRGVWFLFDHATTTTVGWTGSITFREGRDF